MNTKFFLRPAHTRAGFLRVPHTPIANQNNDTDLLAALAAGDEFRLTRHVARDTDDWSVLAENTVDPCDLAEAFDEAEEVGADMPSAGWPSGFPADPNAVSIRTIEDILSDIEALAAEPTAEELIADFYRNRT